MRNAIDPNHLRRIGNLPPMIREDLRVIVEAWYVLEQSRLTDVMNGEQLRQSQGAAQVLRDLSTVLKDPEAFLQNPVPVQRSQFP